MNTKLKAATVKLKKTREERDQFDEASNQIVLHLKTKVKFLFVSFEFNKNLKHALSKHGSHLFDFVF